MLYLRLIKESIFMAWHALVVNKLRTFLSLLGVTIGIFAIISVFTAVDSLESNVKGSLDQLGSNVIYVQKWPWAFGGDYPWWKYWQRPVPSYKEMDELKHRNNLAEGFCFMANIGNATVKFKSNSVENCELSLVSHDFAQINSFNLESGRYFAESESYGGYPVAIIGNSIKDALFPNSDALDQSIIIRGRKVKIIGVFAKEGESLIGNSNDNGITLPVNFATKFIDLKSDRIDPVIMVKAKPGISNAELMDELKANMRSIRRQRPMEDDSFALNETKLLSTQVSGLFDAISIAGWIIGGFSILVGGFGIANIMFVSVKERTPLIGIQKSLGAKNYFILIQFLSESIVLCLFGGILGLVLVYIGTIVAGFFDFNMVLTFSNIVLGLTVSTIIGLVSGFIPAYNASRLDPVEAIRANG
jgi:putative ABC transport system permease protein